MKQKPSWLAVSELMRRAGAPRVALALSVQGELKSPALAVPSPWPCGPDFAARLGDEVTIHVGATRPGYLSLYNLGTGGSCMRLFPSTGHTCLLTTPSTLELPRPGQPAWSLRGPTTRASGGLEIILAILTPTPHEDDFQEFATTLLRDHLDFDYGIACIEVLGREHVHKGNAA